MCYMDLGIFLTQINPYTEETMHRTVISLLITLICCLPTFVLAATNYSIHAEWTGYAAPSGYTVTGFNLYQEGSLACQTQNNSATSMDCTVSLNGDTTNFTLTASFSDGTESPHSSPFVFTPPSQTTPVASSGNTLIQAGWTAYTPPSGYTVSGYNLYKEGALACQTQNNSATSMDCNVSLTADTTNFTLTAAFSNGTESPHSSPFTLTVSTASTTPPTAVISSSAAAGQAPLAVSFNGSASTASATTSITSYSWNFGDGSSATGASSSHTFTSAGTYNTTLTVTDSKGLTSSASTPIVVTASTTTTNKAPTAAATLTPVTGTSPLTVTFDGSASSDSDGTIASYLWNYGDGSSASGKTATHTYTTEGSFTATLQVTDNKGATGTTSKTITVQPKQQQTADVNIEVGEVMVTNEWARVSLTSSFNTPIVVAGPPSYNNNDPCVVRLRNVDTTGFDIKLAEWNYQDGTHPAEAISYIVMESGRTTLPNGSIIEAGSFTGTTDSKTISFSSAFTKAPVVVTTIASMNETDTISGRLKNIGVSGFAYYFTEQESNWNRHADETVNFIAWEPGTGTVGSIQFEASTTANTVTEAWHQATFNGTFTQSPLLLADMQTTNGGDTAALRTQKGTTTGFQVKVEEEQSKDSEVSHIAETVGYLALSSTETQSQQTTATIWPEGTVPETIDAGSDGPQELGVKFRSDSKGFITGIRFYKASTNTGTHVGNLWTSTGTLLATAVFTNETASGWQQVNFSTPVAITANTVYVASYFCPNGHQSVDREYFSGKGMDSAPLHALADGVSGSNGVYAYGASSTFPKDSYRTSNYWVDVVFTP